MTEALSTLNTAVLYASYGNKASYYNDWLDAFNAAKGFCVSSFNIAKSSSELNLRKSIQQFDLIVLLHSTNADGLLYLGKYRPILQNRKGILLSFVGNEVNLPGAPLKLKIEFLKAAEVDIVATQLVKETGDYLYADTGAKILSIPHALNPRSFSAATDNPSRPIDIGVRSFRYPEVFLGDDDRNRIMDAFSLNHFNPPLNIDIRNDQRLDRTSWNEFLNKCKGTVSNEAGGFWIERDDATMLKIKDWLRERGGRSGLHVSSDTPLRRIVHWLPWGVRQWLIQEVKKGWIRYDALDGHDASFEEVFDTFYKGRALPSVITGKCISSRHFEAAGTKVCQIMIEGRFNDILVANEHYIPVKRDLSDIDEAVRKFRDEGYRQAMIDRTYDYVMSTHTYEHRIRSLEKFLLHSES